MYHYVQDFNSKMEYLQVKLVQKYAEVIVQKKYVKQNVIMLQKE